MLAIDKTLLKDVAFATPDNDNNSDNTNNGVYQILKETALIDKIQSLVELGNSEIFRSFKVCLQLEDAS